MSTLDILFSGFFRRETAVGRSEEERIADILPQKVSPYQGAVVAMNNDGAVRAMVGGTNYQESQFNRALAI